MGPIMIDIAGTRLTDTDRALLRHPNVGGVILFSRNYQDKTQLQTLINEIRESSDQPLVVGVDQEGGRVQRFRDGFTRIPPANLYRQHANGEQLAYDAGLVMATELIECGLDFSFSPVLDIGEACAAIGDRSFGGNTEEVYRFALPYLKGMRDAGMATTGKHFPGHGGVVTDTHYASASDPRSDLLETDAQIFKRLIEEDLLDAVMPAHVIFPAYDSQPASGSSFWLKTVLREQFGFSGVIFSDDLGMKGADVMGSYLDRGQQSLDAGCDILLLCNNPEGQDEMVQGLKARGEAPLAPLVAKQSRVDSVRYQEAVERIRALTW
uniref:beta-N-acetylhexosaminidase n=1 Tax=Thaumasiovibrio occultus TaxID=1891184 RepID=UPI000B356F6E|nr:beta-N-acetylhexosaminidase [Thaumasiovibrio occultus]